MFGGKKATSQKNKAVSALQVQTSTYGPVLPLLYGKNRIAGNLGWYGNWIATPHTDKQQSGGKGGGGGGSASTSYTYTTGTIILLTEGQIAGIGTVWKEQEVHTTGDLGFTVFNGSTPQSAWSWLASFNAAQAVPYSGVAYVAASTLQLGTSTSLPNFNFEVKGLSPYNAGTVDDALPSDILTDYLTNATHGAGFSAWLGDVSQLRTYHLARGLFMSPIEDQQRTAADFVNDMSTWCNFAPVWSYNKLNLLPFGDTAITGTYGTYTPNVTPLYDLGPDDYLYSDGSDIGVELDWKDLEDCHNSIRIEYNDRTNAYNTVVQQAKDQADIDARGSYPMSDIQVNGITDAQTARDVAQLILQRDLYIRKTYSFRTTMKYMLLEPMDVVTLTDPNAGLSRELVRITKASEQDDEMSFEAEELPIGVAHAPQYNTQSPFGYSQDFNVSPGSVAPPVIMNAPSMLTTSGFETWIAVAGIGQWWGGCEVYASEDNLTYKRIGRIVAPARYGALTGSLAAGADPDTANTMNVSLLRGQLTGGTQADADNWRQFAFVGGAGGGEFIAFENATLTGTLSYGLSYLRRGGFGSSSQAHVTGDVFARIDDAIFRIPYDRGKRGATTYFKFVSFNTFGAGMEQLSAVTAYSHVLGASDVLAPPRLYDQLAGQYATPASGSNFVPNPSFELNNIRAPANVTALNMPVCDSWYLSAISTGFSASRDANTTDVGPNNLLLNVAAGTSVPANSSISCVVSSAPIYVQAGQLVSLSGDIFTFSAGGNGANISFNVYLGLNFFNAAGTQVGTMVAGISGATTGTSAYHNYANNQFTVPAGTSYATAFAYVQASNSAASAQTIASWGARFDNLFGQFVTAAGQVNYTTGQSVDSLKPAQPGADVTSNQTLVGIQNPGFDLGLQGWTPESDAANWYGETGTNGPNAGTTTYAVHKGSTTTTFLRNAFKAPVVPGQIIKATCKVKGISSPTGTPAIRILFQDINGSDIASPASPVSSGTVGNSTQLLSVAGTAPSNAAFAIMSPGVGFGTNTNGFYNFDDMAWTYQPNSVDEVPDGATYVRNVQQSTAASALTVDNATFQLAPDSTGAIPGWSASPSTTGAALQGASPSPAVGSQYLVVHAPSSGPGAMVTNRRYAVNPGDSISVGGLMDAASGVFSAITVTFTTNNGTFVSSIAAGGSSPTWQAVTASGVVPPTAAYMILGCYCGTASQFAAFNYVWCSVNDVRVAGSGAQIGDQRNLKQRTVTNIPAKVPTTISYTATAGSPATATISVGAFTVLNGSVSTAYNASSVSVSGTNGTTPTYYLYMNDPKFSGGVQTLIATTNGNDLYTGDGYVYVGPVQVAYPTSGGGSGGGGGGGSGSCVCAHMWLDQDTQASEAVKGFLADCLDIPSSGLRKFRRRLRGMEMSTQPCVRLTTSGGAVLECSASTPFDLPSGGMTYAPEMEGLEVITDKGVEVVASVVEIGEQLVCHQHYGGCSYAAGADPSHRIYSHNVIAKP
jgi:hypothetical protein